MSQFVEETGLYEKLKDHSEDIRQRVLEHNSHLLLKMGPDSLEHETI